MAPDVAVPDPPDLSTRGTPRDFEMDEDTLGWDEFHREDLEDLLQEGAWTEGFNEWVEYTDLDAAQVRAASERGLFQALDFYWDPLDEQLRFASPAGPDDWPEQATTGSLDSATVSLITAELQDLGRTVQETLEAYFDEADGAPDVDWT